VLYITSRRPELNQLFCNNYFQLSNNNGISLDTGLITSSSFFPIQHHHLAFDSVGVKYPNPITPTNHPNKVNCQLAVRFATTTKISIQLVKSIILPTCSWLSLFSQDGRRRYSE
jgi:hypothetical protein